MQVLNKRTVILQVSVASTNHYAVLHLASLCARSTALYDPNIYHHTVLSTTVLIAFSPACKSVSFTTVTRHTDTAAPAIKKTLCSTGRVRRPFWLGSHLGSTLDDSTVLFCSEEQRCFTSRDRRSERHRDEQRDIACFSMSQTIHQASKLATSLAALPRSRQTTDPPLRWSS